MRENKLRTQAGTKPASANKNLFEYRKFEEIFLLLRTPMPIPRNLPVLKDKRIIRLHGGGFLRLGLMRGQCSDSAPFSAS